MEVEYACQHDGDAVGRSFRALQSGVRSIDAKKKRLAELRAIARNTTATDPDSRRARLAYIEAEGLDAEIRATEAALGDAVDSHNEVCDRSHDRRNVLWRK